MKTKMYLKRIDDLLKKYPNAKIVIDKSRKTNDVRMLPRPGFWDGFRFTSYDKPVNAICVN